jgi:aryl-alcohol dehydrogenase-like predicted oxidoreductase
MGQDMPAWQRRQFLQWLAGLGATVTLAPGLAAPGPAAIRKTIPAAAKKFQSFFDHGGALIDSSPMYGSSQEVIGHGLRQIRNKSAQFAATKVWIYGQWPGIKQMEAARAAGPC